VIVQFQFVTETGWKHLGSALIRYWSWSDFSHIDLVLNHTQLLGARADKIGNIPPGVRVRPDHYLPFSKVLVADFNCNPEEGSAIYAAAVSQIGKGYDKEAILDFGLHDNDPPPDADSKAWICSTFIQWLTIRAGRPLLNPKVNPWRITPGDLLKSPLLSY
jgi:hypothetical protein